MMRKGRIFALALALSLIFGAVSAFASTSSEVTPLDPGNPILRTYYTCEDGRNYDSLSFKLSGLENAEIVFGKFAYDADKTYRESQQFTEGWVVSGKTIYKLRELSNSTPGSIAGENPDYTGTYFGYKFELVPTNEIPSNSIISTHKHGSAVDVETVKYLVNGKEVSRAEYDKAKTGAYTENMKLRFTGEGKETVSREEMTFDKLITLQQVGPGSDAAPWSATFSFIKDQYIIVEHSYLRTYEITKSDASSTGSKTSSSNLNDKAKETAKIKTNTTVVIDAPTVTAAAINKALKSKNLSKASVKTITLGKNVKKIKKGAFKGYKNAKTLVVKTKKLKKATVKGSLAGSKITTVKVSVGTKSVNKKYVKAYKKIFTKKNVGKKVKVS